MPTDGVVGRRCVLIHLLAPSIISRFDGLAGRSIGLLENSDLPPQVGEVIMIFS